MMRRILAIVVGLAGCGDSLHLLTDAGPPDAPTADAGAAADAASSDSSSVDPSLILNYDFEDSTTVVADGSGRGKNATLNDVAAWTAAGRVNRGLALTGGSPAARFVTLPDGVLTGVSDFTISAWVKANTVSNWVRVYDIGNGTPGTDWMFLTLHGFTPPPVVDDGIHTSSFGGANDEIINSSSTQFPTGVWKHLTVTGSGGTRQLYIDGYPAATLASNLTVPPSAMEPMGGNSWIGRSRFEAAGDPGLDATLDQFRIYNRVLTQPEIADLAWPQHDYSYWRFDEASGMTAKDSSDNAVPTVLKNGPTWTAGRLGGALDFPGSAAMPNGPYATLASSPLASCTTQLTVSTWVKLHSQDNWARVFDFGTGTTAFIYLTLFDDRPPPSQGAPDAHGMHFAMVSPNGVFDMFTAAPPVAGDDTWHHVAVTLNDAGLATMYVDGAIILTQQNTSGAKVSDFAATTENYFGKSRFEATDAYLHAALDDLRISCRAFTADEIKSLSRP